MGTRGHLPTPGKMYKARFDSVTTFWSAQKEPKSLSPEMFYGFKIHVYLNAKRRWWGSKWSVPLEQIFQQITAYQIMHKYRN